MNNKYKTGKEIGWYKNSHVGSNSN